MRVRGDDTSVEEALGAGGEVEIVPLLVPMTTYKLISEMASREGCTAGEYMERALVSYMKRGMEQEAKAQEPPVRRVDVVLKKRQGG